MSKVKSFQLFILAMIVLSFMFPFVGNASVQTSVNLGANEKRPDIITLELSAELSKNEMPAVDFLHDKHTQALEGDCASCHTQEDKAFVFKFKRTGKDGVTGSMDLYHNECVACHVEKKSESKTSGPMTAECRTCHAEGESVGSSWAKLDFDKSLHYVHERAKPIKAINSEDQNNCSACHHKANEKTNEIFYVKGEEESCAYCHAPAKEVQIGQENQGNNQVRPIRGAAHDSCVKCHQTLFGQNVAAGPTTCNGCHDLEKQKEIEKVVDIPRLKRNQPDEVALTGWKLGSKLEKTFMLGVAFDHKSHESNTQSCKSCHHETLKKCSECHDAEGGELSGGFVSLEQAMHNTNSDRSCMGCHKKETKNKDCAGCHSLASAYKTDSESCKSCHTMDPVKLNSGDSAQMARVALTSQYEPVAQKSIPETVVIKTLSSEYKASSFPHRKVINAIAQRVEKSEMAKSFHEDQAGLCMGCHHNSPKTLEPPKCGSCHSKKGLSINAQSDGRPGLKGAYHGQCITCHQKMEVETVLATDCVKCHEEKK